MESLESSKESNIKNIKGNQDIFDEEEENAQIIRYEIDDYKLVNNFLVKKIQKKRLPLLFYINVISIILLITSLIYLIVVLVNKKENYIYEDDKIEKPALTHYSYSNLTFDNGLQVLFVQIGENDEAGGSVVFDIGYFNNQFPEDEFGVAFASMLNIFGEKNINDATNHLYDYQGEFTRIIEPYYSYFSFNILNAEFFKFLEKFNNITFLKENDKRFENIFKLDQNESRIERNNEQILLETIVYNHSQPKIPPSVNYITYIKRIMKYFLKPDKMKIVLASHFKPSLMKKKFLRYFKNTINEDNKKENYEDLNFNYSNFPKKKVIYFITKEEPKNSDFFKIIYFIDKAQNEDYYEFINKLGYFNYIKYILDETNEGSLYYELFKSKDFTIKSLSCDYEIILQSKVKFEIKVDLAPSSYDYLDRIIFLIYQYMNRMIKSILEEKIDSKFFKELKTINQQKFIFQEDYINDIQSFTTKLGIKLCEKRKSNVFLKENYLESFKIEIAKKYYSQFIPDNSVILLKCDIYKIDTDINKSNINIIDYDYFFNINNQKSILGYNINYTITELDTSFEKEFKVQNINIPFKENKYISQYLKPIGIDEEDKKNYIYRTQILKANNSFLEFKYLKDSTFRLPKAFMTLNLYHPFIRPNKTIDNKDCLYFESILFIAFIQRKINFELADSIRAGNEISINYNQNYIFIDIFAYTDIIKTIAEEIYNIIYNEEFNKIHEKDKIQLYLELAYENFLNKPKKVEKSQFLLYFGLNDNIYNYYDFNYEFNNDFESYENKCGATSKAINNGYLKDYFLIVGNIYGYCTKEKALEIFDVFGKKDKDTQEEKINMFNKEILDKAGYNNSNLTITNFKDWIINESKDINKGNYKLSLSRNTLEDRIYRFIKWSDYSTIKKFKATAIKNILKKIDKDRKNEMSFIDYKGIYFKIECKELLGFYNETFFEEQYTETIKKFYEYKDYYSKKVDTVGDKFYYLISDLIDRECIKPKDMKHSAIQSLFSNLYEQDDFTELYVKKNELKNMDYEDLIEEFKEQYYNNHIDIVCNFE